MTRQKPLLPILLLAPYNLPAPEPDIDEFFEKFTAEWVRADPQLATTTQYFTGAEQDKLDRQLTPQTAQFRVGLHTKGWTCEQAIDYGVPVSEVERYVVLPGQACEYMIGQLKILELRERARRELGDSFSLKEFHNLVLRTGAVPLEVLESVVDDYVRAKKL